MQRRVFVPFEAESGDEKDTLRSQPLLGLCLPNQMTISWVLIQAERSELLARRVPCLLWDEFRRQRRV